MNIDDVQLLLAAPQAAGGYSSPGTVYNSNGRWCSTTQLNSSVTLDNLFPDLTGPQNAASQVDYQCLFVFNTDTDLTLTNVVAWIPASSVLGPVSWAVGVDSTGATAYNADPDSGTQAAYIASPTLAPSTVSAWAGPVSSASSGLSMVSIGPQEVAALWVRRTATNSAAYTGATFGLQVTFDTLG